jgi:hypothetical protein
MCTILDGGSLLHHLPWTKGKRYEKLCQMYVDFIIAKYGSATIVFDGYGEDPSTKDAAHLRRTGGVCSTSINFTGNMILNSKEEQFLSNPHNKQIFIDMLSDKLHEHGCTVHHAEGDADVLIVAKTMESARQKGTILIGEDTDLLILLLHYMNEKMCDVFFKPEQKKNVKHVKVWDIKAAKKKLGKELTDNILVIHALLGCDTTSRIFGVGKGVGVKLFRSSKSFCKAVKVLNKDISVIDQQSIISAGEKALVTVCRGNEGETLNTLRVRRFTQKVAESRSVVEPASLPPNFCFSKVPYIKSVPPSTELERKGTAS